MSVIQGNTTVTVFGESKLSDSLILVDTEFDFKADCSMVPLVICVISLESQMKTVCTKLMTEEKLNWPFLKLFPCPQTNHFLISTYWVRNNCKWSSSH